MTTSVVRRAQSWIGERLGRKLAATLVASLLLTSLAFLTVLISTYRGRVLEERSFASTELNNLLQIGLETAMLNRDIEALRRMVDRLGKEERIVRVLILAPSGEVRFSSDSALLGRTFDVKSGELCPGCAPAGPREAVMAHYISTAQTGDVLRSINPVRNREPCTQCHGRIDANPVNGILVVDYDAARIKHDTFLAALSLTGAGLVVMLSAIGGIGWMLNRNVLEPLTRLTTAAGHMSQGVRGARVPDVGSDELGRLGHAFNDMSGRIDESLRALEEREHRLQSIIDAVPDGIRVLSMDFRVLGANDAFCKQLGLSMEEVVSRPCYASSHRREAPCPPTLVTCPIVALCNEAGPLTCRHRHVDRNGQDFQVEVSAAAFTVGSGPTAERVIVEVVRDLRHDIHLSHEQRLSELGFLAAGVAHEIHNPLASIQFGLASIKRSISEQRFDDAGRYVGVIDGEIERCIEVTSRLLKLSAGRTEHPELVVLDGVVEDVLSLLKGEAETRNVEFRTSFNGDLRIIASDGDIRMLVLNIAQNALHAMPSGGTLTIRGRKDERSCVLTFADTGVGIAPEDLKRIFDPFWSRRADGVHGTGLGLAICSEIIKHWRGRIAVASERGTGTTFTVTLPSADAALEAS